MVNPEWLQKPVTELTNSQIRKVKYLHENNIREYEIVLSNTEDKSDEQAKGFVRRRLQRSEGKLQEIKQEIQKRKKEGSMR